ncbi:MAG: hypothetical protein V3S01_07605, partial [Dehalococcoidia bacterium]
HRYHPDAKFRAIDRAIRQVTELLFLECRDDTITADGYGVEFCIPTNMRLGPEWALIEEPIQVNVAENWLQTPKLDATTGWAAGCTTALVVTRTAQDRLIPKHGEKATKLTTAACTAGTYTQVAACLSSCVCTPLTFARDKHMYLGAWVHSTETVKVKLNLIDDCATTSGACHQGKGWEWLTVDATIPGANATTLSAQVAIASTANASVVHVQCAMLRHGPIPSFYRTDNATRVERCEVTNLVYLRDAPPAGYQVRLIGKKPLSLLGGTPATQITNTVEVDANSAELLYSRAAQLLFTGDLLNTPGFRDIGARIQVSQAEERKLTRQWKYQEKGGMVIGPYHR